MNGFGLKQLIELRDSINSNKLIPKNNIAYLAIISDLNKRIDQLKKK